MPDRPIAGSPERCAPHPTLYDVNGLHKCNGQTGAPDPSWYYLHPGRISPADKANPFRTLPDISRGFNFGVLLLPYMLDWGPIVGIMTRRKAYPTVFHSFPRSTDRAYALASASYFCSPKDSYFPKFINYLCVAKPFAGWRWDGHLAQRWLTYAQAKADSYGAEKSLDSVQAVEAAVAWCASDVVQFWKLSTRERFPYSPPDLVQYWRGNPGADLP